MLGMHGQGFNLTLAFLTKLRTDRLKQGKDNILEERVTLDEEIGCVGGYP